MIPAAFDYEVAESVDHAVGLLGEREDAKLLAGGHSLVPAMKLRIARPASLIDIGRLDDLSYVTEEGDTIAIGALTRHKDVAGASLLQEHCPIVSFTAGQIGDPQVRHRGTIGGSLAHGDPASDLPTVILALRRRARCTRPGGRSGDRGHGVLHRCLPDGARAGRDARGDSRSEARLGRLVVYEDEPSSPGLGNGRRCGRDEDERCAPTTIALTNMGATPLRAHASEDALAGGSSIEDAAALAAEGTEPSSDHAASAEFRRHLARVLTKRALVEAASR